MRNTLFLLLALTVSAACTKELHFQGTPRFSHEPHARERSDTLSLPEGTAAETHVYLTAVRFPEGYDWELDTCAVEGPVWLDLYRDGVLAASFPAGESLAPDMHRFEGGHFYADASTDSETILYRDGRELFRFAGRESLRGFLVLDGAVHTLGQDRDGSGLTYRIDGRAAYRSETGTVLGDLDRAGRKGGALFADGDDVRYGFFLPTGETGEYRVMRGAALEQAFPEEADARLYDLLLQDGKVYRTQTRYQRLYFYEAGQFTLLQGLLSGETVQLARIISFQGGTLVLARTQGPYGRRSLIFPTDGVSRAFVPDGMVTDILTDGEKAGWLVTDGEGTPLQFCPADAPPVIFPALGLLASGRCALLHEGKLLLALTGRDGAPGLLYRDGQVTEIPFNGYFTSITVE